jgi:predicted pyridoxine 5'-phosphate oxidase superfamily flavin-nucleotide-binding protein
VGREYDRIDDHWRDWIARQPLFFVGSAPLAGDGHVNVSPKGPRGSLRVLDDRTIAYLDVVGSGAETIAHVRDNGRIVVMFCAFDGPPKIVRLHGRGEVLEPGDSRFAELLARFEPPEHALRSLIRVEVERIADSCGYGVPLMQFEGKRSQYDAWVDKKLRDGGLDEYVATKNRESIDGLPAVSR